MSPSEYRVGAAVLRIDPEGPDVTWLVEGREADAATATRAVPRSELDHAVRAATRDLRDRARDAGAAGPALRLLAARVWTEYREGLAADGRQGRLPL